MEKIGIIRKSMSSWSSSVTLVDKSNGKIRKCKNYKKVNDVIITYAYFMLKMNEELKKYRKAKWFTSFDIILGFWQIEIEEESKEITAFIMQYELYEYDIILFELKNILTIFQILMNEILREYLDDFITVYINNILI